MTKTAILVDGGFYRKRANYFWKKVSPKERADELQKYCYLHLKDKDSDSDCQLYRIFYYDCPPVNVPVYHPFLKKNIILSQTDTFEWSTDFFKELKKKRKFALRMGTISESSIHYNLSKDVTKKLFGDGPLTFNDIVESNFVFNADQKGVDMKIGLDIASMAFKKQVDQMILISGDSDFVPAAKLARREGIDFILDSMGANVKDNLLEHIDGLRSHYNDMNR